MGFDSAPAMTDLHVDGDLEVVLLLAHKRLIGVGEVEAFVGVHTEGWHGPAHGGDDGGSDGGRDRDDGRGNSRRIRMTRYNIHRN